MTRRLGADEWASSERWKDGSAAGRHRDVLDALGAFRRPCEKVVPEALFWLRKPWALGDFATAAEWADSRLDAGPTGGDRLAELRRAQLSRGDRAAPRRRHRGRGALNDGLEVARTLHDHAAEARGLNNLGILADIRGDHEARWPVIDGARCLPNRSATCAASPETYHNIGISLRDQGNSRAALGAAEESLALRHPAGDEQLVALATTG